MALTESIETIDERPTCCTYAAGRVFYGMNNTVYYSQVIEGESVDHLNKCHQMSDPTAEQLADLLATDGGTIPINNAVNIKQIKAFGNGVLVYASNGVWYISGPDTGFTATNFFRKSVSKAGLASPQSVVTVEAEQYFWSREGIYRIAINQTGQVEATSIIEGTLQTFYNDIPVAAREKVSGSYDRIKKQVEWFYGSDTQTGATEYKYAHDLSIIYDVRTQGIWPQQYNSTLTEAAGDFVVGGVRTNLSTIAQEIAYLTITTGTPSSTQTYSVDFAFKTDTGFQDFGTDYTTAFIEAGYETLDKPSNSKVAPYTYLHFKQTEENFVSDGLGGLKLDLQSGCQLQSQWDWNDSTANGRWGPSQQAYKFRRVYIPLAAGPFLSGETVVSTKLKVLGRGKALSLRFEQEAGKDMQLLGYTTVYSVKGRM